MIGLASLDELRALIVPLLKWFGVVLGVLTLLGLVVVRVAAGRLRRQAFGPGGGLK